MELTPRTIATERKWGGCTGGDGNVMDVTFEMKGGKHQKGKIRVQYDSATWYLQWTHLQLLPQSVF